MRAVSGANSLRRAGEEAGSSLEEKSSRQRAGQVRRTRGWRMGAEAGAEGAGGKGRRSGGQTGNSQTGHATGCPLKGFGICWEWNEEPWGF